MRILPTASRTALATAGLVGLSAMTRTTVAFVPKAATSRWIVETTRTKVWDSNTPCDVDPGVVVPDLVASKGSARILRQATLKNVKGEAVVLGDYMGSRTDPSIVVFLRHLAILQQQQQQQQSFQGPVFVSIGTPAKLERFLELNPNVPRDSILVDDYEHQLYKDLGFSRFDELETMEQVSAGKLSAFLVQLSPKRLIQYVANVLQLAPVEGSVDWLNLPEGGLRNGGTLIVQGDNVIYQWNDSIPSDVPDVQDVIQIANQAAATQKVK